MFPYWEQAKKNGGGGDQTADVVGVWPIHWQDAKKVDLALVAIDLLSDMPDCKGLLGDCS
jgi:hypothetical protein